MGVVALQTGFTFYKSRVLIDLIGKLREIFRFTDEFGVAVKTLPTGLVNHFGIGDLFLATNVNAQWTMTTFARQVFVLQLPRLLDNLFMACPARVITAV